MARGERAAIVLVWLLLVSLLAIRFDAPWQYIHDDNGAWTQAMATAHLRAGLGATLGQGALVRRADGGLDRYLHHPPLYPLIVAATYRATGRSDPAITRLVPAAFHAVLGFGALVILSSILFPGSPARRIVALGIYALVPMSAFFGKMPNYEPPGLAWVTAAVVATCLHRRDGGRGALAAALVLWTLAGLTAWASHAVALGFVALFALEARAGHDRGRMRTALLIAAASAASAALVLAHIRWIGDRSAFAAGSYWATASMSPAEALHSLGTVFDFHRMYFANVPFLIYLVWGFGRARDLLARHSLPEHQRVLLAGSAGIALYSLFFLRALAIHAYGQFWFLPFEALAVGDVAVGSWERLRSRPRLRLALAGAVVLGTLASTAFTLAYRYSHRHGYAVRMAQDIAARYHLAP